MYLNSVNSIFFWIIKLFLTFIGGFYRSNSGKYNGGRDLGQAGLEAAFQVPMPGDSDSSPNASSISNYCLTQEIFKLFSLRPQRIAVLQ